MLMGSKRIGIAIDALNDLENTPLLSTSASPVIILVAIQINGIGNSLNDIESEYPTESELNKSIRLSPDTIPVGNEFLNERN